MGRAEITDRARQEISKLLDVALSRIGYHFEERVAASDRAPHFFFDAASIDEILQIIRTRFSSEAEELVHRAEQALLHSFDLLGYRAVDYGAEIDWHLDAVHDVRAPRVAFHRIRYLDYDEAGDVKVTWELNRHQHFVWLAMVYRLTGDGRFSDEIVRQWRHWCTCNPYPIGVNWASSLEVGFRSLSWIWTYFLLSGTPAMSDALRRQWRCALAVNARHIERYLSTYFSPNTHLLGEGVALFFIGALFPELRSARRWLRRGWNIVLSELRHQVRSDGMHFEQSTYYHVYAVDLFLHSMILARRNGLHVSARSVQRVIAMLDALAVLSRTGSPPKLGDDDGGRVFDGQRNGQKQLVDSLSIGAALFGREDFKSIARRPTIEMLWLLGASGMDAWDALSPSATPAQSVALVDSGLYCMARADAAEQLIVDAGTQGGLHAGHGHADALSVCLSSGVDFLIDPGTCEYVDVNGRRSAYRGTSAHNTLRIDERDQADQKGPFSWESTPRVIPEIWIGNETFDLFRASHDGYTRLEQPAVHRRWIFTLKSGFWFVRDVVEGAGRHHLALSWHVGPDLKRENAPGWLFCSNGEHSFRIVPEGDRAWSEEMREDFCSPVYGRLQPSSVLTFSSEQVLPADFACMLVTSPAAIGTLSRLEDTHNGLRAYQYAMKDAELVLVFASPHETWSVGSLTSDAEFACWKRSDVEEVLILCNASKAVVDSRPVIDFEVPVAQYVASPAGRQRL